jgi:hypothetical protein
MNNNISNDIKRKAEQIKMYALIKYPQDTGKAAMRFINENFRKQSYEGLPWKKRRGGKRNNGRALLIDKGTLRRGNNFKTGPGAVTIYNYVKYAKAHNEGVNATVAIKAHNRRLFGKFKVTSLKTRKTSTKRLEKATVNVKAHSRWMRIPRRQFMPTAERPSPTLTRTVYRDVQLQMLKILKS